MLLHRAFLPNPDLATLSRLSLKARDHVCGNTILFALCGINESHD